MIKSICKKIDRYLRIETQWRISLLIVMLLVFVIRLEFNILDRNQEQIRALKAKAGLIRQIPAMEKEMAARRKKQEALRRAKERRRRLAEEARLLEEQRRLAEAEKNRFKNEPIPVFGGVGSVDGTIAALLDGEVYLEGQYVGNFLVKEITEDQVILEHKINKVIHKLTFTDPNENLLPWFENK